MWMMPVFRSRLPLAVVAVFAALLLLLAACDDGDDGGETPEADGDTPAAEATSDGGVPADGTPAAEETPGGGTPDGDGGQTIVQMVTGRQFSPGELFIAAGTDVTITADNTDPGIPHSFAIYNSQQDADGGADPVAETERCNGACQDDVTVNLDGGAYFFRCEVHGSSMSGTLTAR